MFTALETACRAMTRELLGRRGRSQRVRTVVVMLKIQSGGRELHGIFPKMHWGKGGWHALHACEGTAALIRDGLPVTRRADPRNLRRGIVMSVGDGRA